MKNMIAENLNNAIKNDPAPINPVIRLYANGNIEIESALIDADETIQAEWTWNQFLSWAGEEIIDSESIVALRSAMLNY